MAKKRYINTKFWSDNFVVKLNPLDRYLFLYLLTNEHTDICGIYELSWGVMSRETGIEDDMLKKMFRRLKGRIFYLDGYVFIKNFSRHQSVNPSIEEGIKRSLEQIPDKIKAKIKQLENTDCPSVPTGSDLLKPIPKPKPIFNISSAKIYSGSQAIGELLKNKLQNYKVDKNQQWQDEALEALKFFPDGEQKRSSLFKCFKENLTQARSAFNDCKELGKPSILYFLKVYNESVKKST